MLELRSELDISSRETLYPSSLPISFHATFYPVYEKLQKLIARFPLSVDNSIFNDLSLLYLLATTKFLDHRIAAHIFRLSLSLHLMQKKLMRAATFSPHVRHLKIRWFPANLYFPFSNKPVMGCLIGFNLMGRYEVFDEENVVLALQKHLPQLRLVKESSYCHTSQHKNLKIFYFEIEKKDGSFFSLQEQKFLKTNLEEKVRKSIQPLSPNIFMGLNDEEIYKNTLVLSQEIQSLDDLPQAYITLDQQTGKKIIFRVNLVHICPFHRFSLKERFFDSKFVSQRVLTVKHIENHPIQAHVFCLHLPRDPSILRSDGSLDFYTARQKVAALITNAIGEFRDYNGGIIIQQQQQLQSFKEKFPEIVNRDPELIENFFYATTPLEKQILLPQETLCCLFNSFLDGRKSKLPKATAFSLKIYRHEDQVYLVVRADDSSVNSTIMNVLQEQSFITLDIAYNFIDTKDGLFFNCTMMGDSLADSLINTLQEALNKWQLKIKGRQSLRIGLEYSIVSLDPRIGGESVSGDVLRFLFEGLTRFNLNGDVENGIAESIEISSNQKHYTFKLRTAFWNDGSPVTAYDFEYAWKKILSPNFKTSFAYLFYPIKNAKLAKEGKVPPEEVGIYAIDNKTLKVELGHHAPHFLQNTAQPLYSPVHRLIDQQHPQWPYECEKSYPCNGPFQLKVNQPNHGYVLVKNPFYWDAHHISLDQINLTQMNPAQAIQAFRNKEIDLVGNPFGGWHFFDSPNEDDQVISFPDSWVCWCAFNTAQPPFHHPKLRKAIAYAIQRNPIVANAFMPLNPAYSPLLPHYRQGGQALFPDYESKMARKLFHEALDELNMTQKDFPALSITFLEKGIREYAAQCLKEQIEECFGIDCQLKPLPWKAVFQKMTKGNFQIGLMHWTSLVDDPLDMLKVFRSANEDINFTKWENVEFQKLLDLSEQEPNPFQRSSYLFKAENILSEEMPIIPLFYQPQQLIARKDFNINYRTPCGPFNIARSSWEI